MEYLDNSLKESDISNVQECYLVSDLNVNLLNRNKILVKKYLTLTARLNRLQQRLIAHTIANSSENVIHSDATE